MIIDLLSAIDTLNSIKALLAESIRTQLDLKNLTFPCRLGDLNLCLVDTNLYRLEKIGVSNIETRDFSELNLETLISLHSQLDLINPTDNFYSMELLVKRNAIDESLDAYSDSGFTDYAQKVMNKADTSYNQGLSNASLLILSESLINSDGFLISTGVPELDLELIKLNKAKVDKFAVYLE